LSAIVIMYLFIYKSGLLMLSC